jgi:hypothetical protein
MLLCTARWMEHEKECVMRKISPNPERILNGGLCGTCRNAPTCMYLRNSSKPILHCEEFEEFPCDADNNPMEAKMSLVRSEGNPQEKSKYFGLCANCKHRDTCTFPKPQGGVWHCEEYE